MSRQTWTIEEVADLVGIKRRTLTAWLHRGPARASVAPPRGPRKTIRLNIDDVLEVWTIAYLREQGFSMQKVRQVVTNLRQLVAKGLSTYSLVVVQANSEVVLVQGRWQLEELSRKFGQIVILPIQEWLERATGIERKEPTVPSRITRKPTDAELEELAEGDAKSAQVWGQLKDSWAVVNATDEEVYEVAKADPWPGEYGWHDTDIAELNRVRKAFHTLYRLTAEGCQGSKQFAEASEIVAELLPTSIHFVAVGGVTYLELSAGDYKLPRGTTLISHVYPYFFNELEGHLIGASASTIFICECCGRIGPAKQKNKRFCNTTCRVRTFREKHIMLYCVTE